MQAIATMLREGCTPSLHLQLADVAAQMQRLLCSRSGQALSSPHYGTALGRDAVRDALAHLPEMSPVLENAVLQALTAQEPRLQGWQLRDESTVGAHALTLHLTARWRRGRQHSASFEIEIMASGRFTVRPL